MKARSRLWAALALGLTVTCGPAASAAEAEPTADTPAAAPGNGGAAPVPPADKEALQQAFDGAMTCAALTAIKANQAPPAEAWHWGNRSFAFAMLAVRFYSDATGQPLPQDELNNILTEYANALISMPGDKQQPFEEGCGRKYADMDRLCEANACPHQPPAAEGADAARTRPVPAEAPAAAE